MHRVPPAAIHDGNGTWTPCGLPRFPCPSVPPPGPCGACGARRATLRVRRGPCPSASVRAPEAPPLPQDGWTDREGEEGGGRGMAGDGEGTNEYIYIDEYEYEEI